MESASRFVNRESDHQYLLSTYTCDSTGQQDHSTMRNKIYLFIVLRKYDRVLNVLNVLKRNSIFL